MEELMSAAWDYEKHTGSRLVGAVILPGDYVELARDVTAGKAPPGSRIHPDSIILETNAGKLMVQAGS
jgi:hypothetical protein